MKRALVGNASSERQVARARQIEKQRDDQFAADLAAVLETDAGVRVWTTLLERWSGFRSPFSTKALVMAFRAGQQDTAFKLLADADAVPGAMARLLAERSRREDEERRLTGAKDSDEEDE